MLYFAIGFIIGAATLAAGVWLGYRMGYRSITGNPLPLSTQDFGGVVLDASSYGEAADE